MSSMAADNARIAASFGKRSSMIVHKVSPFNAETARDVLTGAELTPLDAFYVRSHGEVPAADASWRLRVGGLVDRPLELSLEELRRRYSEHTLIATLQCAGNRRADLLGVRAIPGEDPWGPGATGTAVWHGARLADVLAAAGLQDGARHVELVGADISDLEEPSRRYGSSINRRKALGEEVLLAWAMNGNELPPVHGAPLRAVVPGYIGARSVKWLDEIAARAEPSTNHFQASAYRLLPADLDPEDARPGDGIPLGAIVLNTAILEPAPETTVPEGPLHVAGYALAGDERTVARVEVSTDRGRSWQQAVVDGPPRPFAWRRWHAELEAPAGAMEIVARAWDSAGSTQPEEPSHVWNPKGYANSSWARVAVIVGA